MIKDIWKPVFKGSGVNREILYYELVDTNNTIFLKKSGYIVRYVCDVCDSDKLKTTTSSSIFLYNKLESQSCRSCRSKEANCKKSVEYLEIKQSFSKYNYKLITTEEEYNISNHKSQMKLSCVCENEHDYKCSWNNWNKGKRCRKCYDYNRFSDSVKSKDEWKLYHFLVWKYTNENYKKYYNIINPNGLKRGKLKSDYNIDHRFSISEGFKNNIKPEIISSVYNLEMISRGENFSKGTNCSIKLEDLLEKYNFIHHL